MPLCCNEGAVKLIFYVFKAAQEREREKVSVMWTSSRVVQWREEKGRGSKMHFQSLCKVMGCKESGSVGHLQREGCLRKQKMLGCKIHSTNLFLVNARAHTIGSVSKGVKTGQ